MEYPFTSALGRPWGGLGGALGRDEVPLRFAPPWLQPAWRTRPPLVQDEALVRLACKYGVSDDSWAAMLRDEAVPPLSCYTLSQNCTPLPVLCWYIHPSHASYGTPPVS